MSISNRRPDPPLSGAVLFRICLALLCLLPFSCFAAGKLAIIIDDIGYNLDNGRRAADLPGKFTLAVLPFTPHGETLARRGHAQGKEIMLHAPMSNERHLPLGKGGLVVGMSKSRFLNTLRLNLAQTPYVRGVNNHMGSLLTQDRKAMDWLMAELKRRQLYFVDSRTTVKTQALIAAHAIHLPSRRRDIFLDDDRRPEAVTRQLRLALTKASREGAAIAIGHPYAVTLRLLEKIQPRLSQQNIQLVTVSELMPAPVVSPDVSKQTFCVAPPIYLWPQMRIWLSPFTTSKRDTTLGHGRFTKR